MQGYKHIFPYMSLKLGIWWQITTAMHVGEATLHQFIGIFLFLLLRGICQHFYNEIHYTFFQKNPSLFFKKPKYCFLSPSFLVPFSLKLESRLIPKMKTIVYLHSEQIYMYIEYDHFVKLFYFRFTCAPPDSGITFIRCSMLKDSKAKKIKIL